MSARARMASRGLLLASLATLLWASCAQAATPPTAVTGPNTPEAGGKVRLLGYVGPEGSKISACKFIYGPQAGNYTSEAPCANHPGDEVQALTVGATGGQFRLIDAEHAEHNGTTGTADLTAGSNLITNVSTATGQFAVGEPLRNEGDGASALAPEALVTAVGPGTLEVSPAATATKTATPLQSERVEITADLPFDASASEVQSALEALPGIGAGGVSVTRPVDTPEYRLYLIVFQGPLADTNIEASNNHGGPLSAESGTQPLSATPEKPYLEVETPIEGGLTEPHEVTANLTGLVPGATYHYRLVAENAAGKAESPDAIFKALEEPSTSPCPNAGAPGAGFLPECRAWEMVSPPDKNGGDVLANARGTRIAGDGSAVEFESPNSFGDAISASADSEYEAIRTSSGWLTHSILPPQPPTTFEIAASGGAMPHYEGDFSPDLNTGAFFAFRPLDNTDPNVEEVTNLYVRNDLRSPGSGSYRLLTRCPLCAENGKKLEGLTTAPRFVAATPDFKHILFESKFNLVKPAQGTSVKLYEDEEGTLRLVGILPNGQPASESHVGITQLNIELLTAPHALSSEGSKVFWSDGANLYMRLNHETTVKLNESQLAIPEAPGPAEFLDASRDGSRVFFATAERLTEDAVPGGNTEQLYVCDTTKPPDDPQRLTFIGRISSGSRDTYEFLGASAAGDTAYFGSQDDLQTGTSGGGTSLYAWHGGEIKRLSPNRFDQSLGLNSFIWAAHNRVSPDGELLFLSDFPMLGLAGRSNGYCPNTQSKACAQLYTYDPQTEALQCASCTPAGAPANGHSASMEVVNPGAGATTRHFSHPISTDGRHVFFSTAASLVPEDTNGVTDAYTFDTATGQVRLLSRGTSTSPSVFLEASPDGSNALFTTRQRLSGWDIDSNADLYDARVGGGLPEPVSVAASCEGEACLPAPPPSPAREANGSGHFEGKGNVRAPCPHGTRIVHRAGKTRCVKPKHSRKKHRRRAHR